MEVNWTQILWMVIGGIIGLVMGSIVTRTIFNRIINRKNKLAAERMATEIELARRNADEKEGCFYDQGN